MPPRRPSVVLTPNVQRLLDSIRESQPAPEADTQAPGGPLLGGLFDTASKGIAKGFGFVGDSFFGAMKVLDLTRQWVAKPLLGTALVASNPGAYKDDFTGSPADLRRIWDESRVPGPAKFVMELGADPLTWTGLGLWKTPSIKFAESVVPLAAKQGVVGKTLAPLSRAFKVVRTAEKSEGNLAAREAIKSISLGKSVDEAGMRALAQTGVDAGQLTPAAAENLAKMLSAVDDPAMLASWKYGAFGRVVAPVRLARVFGYADTVAEAIWATPFAAAGQVLGPIGGAVGRRALGIYTRYQDVAPLKAVGAFGSGFTRQALRAAGFFGPARIKAGAGLFGVKAGALQRAAQLAEEGAPLSEIFTFLRKPEYESLLVEGRRIKDDTLGAINDYVSRAGAVSGVNSAADVLIAVRQGNEQILEALPLSSEVKGILSGAISKMNIDDETFAQMMRATTEQQLDDALHAATTTHLTKNVFMVERIPEELPTSLFNKSWGMTQRLINIWRPWVTSFQPSFQLLNMGDDIVFRGGGGLVIRNAEELAAHSTRYGFPAEIAQEAAPSMVTMMRDASERMPVINRDRIRKIKVGGKVLGEILDQQAFVTQFGELSGLGQALKAGTWADKWHPSAWGRMFRGMTAKADASAMLASWHKGTNTEFLSLVLKAAPDDEIRLVGQRLTKLREEGQVNPALLDELEKNLGPLVTQPKKTAKFISKAFSYDNITLAELRGFDSFASMPPEWRLAFESEFSRLSAAVGDEALPTRTALLQATDNADREIARLSTAGLREQAKAQIHFENVLDGIFQSLGIKGLKEARQASGQRIRATIDGLAGIFENFDPKAGRYFRRTLSPAVQFANRNVDALIYTHFSMESANAGLISAYFMPSYEEFSQRMTLKITDTMKGLVDNLDDYARHISRGDQVAAKKTLRQMALLHGDFKPLAELENLPVADILRAQFRTTGERIWSQYVGAKFRLADDFVTLLHQGRFNMDELLPPLRTAEQEIFQQGDIAAVRNRWADWRANAAGHAGQQVPHIDPTALKARQALIDERQKVVSEIRGMLQEERGLASAAGEGGVRTPENVSDPERLLELRARETEIDSNLGVAELRGAEKEKAIADWVAPTQPVENLERELLNSYDQIGQATVEAVKRLLPDQYRQFLLDSSRKTREKILSIGLNESRDREGASLLQNLVAEFADMSQNVRLKNRAETLYRTAARTGGLREMRQMMVDYSQQSNLQSVMGNLFPFAAFQLHLPGYLARTFVRRPGVIAIMNHFAQEAQNNYGVTGGMTFGIFDDKAFIFAPQLRFSYLPILAGNNFVRPGEHPANQAVDMLSAFGFSSGPHVQMGIDLANKWGEQLGLPAAEPEFRGGLIPQLRWVQDLTAMAGINNGTGLTVPWLSPSTDIREREAYKNLAQRIGDRIQAKRRELGRDLYPEEVNDIREWVTQHELDDARAEVASRDLAVSLVPGLKIHDTEAVRIRENVVRWMEGEGIEKATPTNVMGKYKKLSTEQKQRLLQQIPEFEDVLAVPPFAETGQEKTARLARTSYFKARDRILSASSKEQKTLDAALAAGKIDVQTYRNNHGDIRTRVAAQLASLDFDPNFKPFVDRERVMPTEPEEMAYVQFQKLTPQDVNNNGIIDEDDLKVFFETRRGFLDNQPSWIKDYIKRRREFNMTGTERQLVSAQDALDGFFDIPAWVGFTSEQSKTAAQVLAKARALSKLTPGETSVAQTIMLLPGVDAQSKVLALQALTAPKNLARYKYWVQHPELDSFYPEFRPDPLTFGARRR